VAAGSDGLISQDAALSSNSSCESSSDGSDFFLGCGLVYIPLKMFDLAVRGTGQMFAQVVALAPRTFAREGAILRDKYLE
jgi:hypothetical protein